MDCTTISGSVWLGRCCGDHPFECQLICRLIFRWLMKASLLQHKADVRVPNKVCLLNRLFRLFLTSSAVDSIDFCSGGMDSSHSCGAYGPRELHSNNSCEHPGKTARRGCCFGFDDSQETSWASHQGDSTLWHAWISMQCDEVFIPTCT